MKKIIGIISCKGGVGKSTIAINLGLYLSLCHKKTICLFDADIYGPNHAKILGLTKTIPTKQNQIQLQKYNTVSISTSNFLNKTSSILLRGPMVSNTLLHLFKLTTKKKFDSVIIDFPPGTGDTYLSLLRDINFYGVFLITTPHLTSIDDISRSVSMLKKFNIKILGIVKNMSMYKCRKCETNNYIYGNANSFDIFVKNEKISNIYSLPINLLISNSSNIGLPFIFFESSKTILHEIHKMCNVFL